MFVGADEEKPPHAPLNAIAGVAVKHSIRQCWIGRGAAARPSRPPVVDQKLMDYLSVVLHSNQICENQ
jgi:hypothetical protein